MRPKHDWFWFGFPLVEKVARVFFDQSQSVAMQNQSKREITFDTQLKTARFKLTIVCLLSPVSPYNRTNDFKKAVENHLPPKSSIGKCY